MQSPLFGVGLQGKSPVITSQRRLNLYYEFQKDQDRTMVSVHGTPGLELFKDLGDTPIRGLFEKGEFLYAVHRGTFYEINNAGVATSRGTINTTSGKVSMATNGTQIMLVDGLDGWIYTISSNAFAEITDGDFPANPETVTYQNTYFIVSIAGSQRFYISAANDGTAWDALDFASAEYDPDDIERVYADSAELVLFGERSTEFWADSGATDFPYTRMQGTQNEWGLAAKWSLAEYDNSLAYLAKNEMGQVLPMRLNGYQPQRMGDDLEFEHIINNYSAVSDASGFAYMLGGHPMYQLNFPAQGASWLFDGATNLWTELKSQGIDRHRAETHVDYLNQTIVGDYSNGRIYKIKGDVYTDNGERIERELVTKHFFDTDQRLTVDSIELLMNSGSGVTTGQGSDPQVMLQVSKDKGRTWGRELWRDIGAIGEYTKRVIWRRLGMARDWTFKLRITDPVPVHITGTVIKARPARS